MRFGCADKRSYTGYEYYPIDDTRIYVVVYYQEFENREAEVNDLKRNEYKEYFIIDDAVKIYDPKKQDLIDSPDSGQILEYFQKAKSEILDDI